MSDSEKPFACTTVGCNMSFVNEDHLTVHKKKHDMMLNLGVNNKSNFFIADQTPTPTRFIRNCDEVGLFQDLQNENPFEETFRRAVEAGKNGELTVPEVNVNDDTLHTPNVFPHITEEPVKATNSTNQIQIAESPAVILTPLEVVTLSNSTSAEESSNINTILENDLTLQSSPSISFNNNNSGLKTDTDLPISSTDGLQLLLKTQGGEILRFVAASEIKTQEDSLNVSPKEQKTKTKVIVKNNNKSDAKVIQSQRSAAVKLKLKRTLTKDGTIVESPSINQNNENENKPEEPKEKVRSSVDRSKKQAILERNRASSMRSRAKRKAWIEQLQQSLKNADKTNANLQNQLKSLHAQVEKLKTLLLAHKDCPVTKAMEEGNGIVIGSKVLAIKPNELKQLPVVVSPSKGVKRSATDKPIVPKKKPLIITGMPSPIILQKSGSTANTLTLHGAEVKATIPTINIVAAPVIASSEVGKTILGFLQSETTKVPLLQSNCFAVNESFSQNAAAKTMGT